MLISISSTPAQISQKFPGNQDQREREQERMDRYSPYQENMGSPPPLLDKPNQLAIETKKRNGIAMAIKEMSQASDELVALTKTESSDFKQVIKLSDKIAKLSKSLRREVTQEKSQAKIEPALITNSDNRTDQLQKLANSIDNLVDQITQIDLVSSIDLSNLEDTRKRLETIESQALSVHILSKYKR
jgi:hypothetical protein